MHDILRNSGKFSGKSGNLSGDEEAMSPSPHRPAPFLDKGLFHRKRRIISASAAPLTSNKDGASASENASPSKVSIAATETIEAALNDKVKSTPRGKSKFNQNVGVVGFFRKQWQTLTHSSSPVHPEARKGNVYRLQGGPSINLPHLHSRENLVDVEMGASNESLIGASLNSPEDDDKRPLLADTTASGVSKNKHSVGVRRQPKQPSPTKSASPSKDNKNNTLNRLGLGVFTGKDGQSLLLAEECELSSDEVSSFASYYLWIKAVSIIVMSHRRKKKSNYMKEDTIQKMNFIFITNKKGNCWELKVLRAKMGDRGPKQHWKAVLPEGDCVVHCLMLFGL